MYYWIFNWVSAKKLYILTDFNVFNVSIEIKIHFFLARLTFLLSLQQSEYLKLYI